MSQQTQSIQTIVRFKLAPHITLGELQGSLLSFKAQSITKVDGEGIVEFFEAISEYLVCENGVSIEELHQRFNLEKDQLRNVFDFLVTNGLCIQSTSNFDMTAFLAYERAGGQVEVNQILHRLKTSMVEVIAHGKNNLAVTLTSSLQETGLNIACKEKLDNERPSIRIAVAASHLDPLLEQVNDQSLEDHVPWLCVIPYDGQTAWVGPFFIPHKSACLHCYNLRKSANFSDEVFRSELLKVKPVNTAKQPVYNQPVHLVQAGIANNLVTEWITLRDYAPSAVPGGFITVNLDDRGVSVDNHRVYRVPRCQKCSPAADTGFPQVWYHGEVAR